VLEALGRAGLRHGAIRPTNIVFDERGGAAFVDAVWSREAPAQYRSPEEARGAGKPDLRSDLYALGLVLYEMLLGMPPFVSKDPRELVELQSRGPVKFDIEGLPPELAEAGRRLTEPEPGRRLGSPAELLRLLEKDERPAPAPAPKPAAAPPPPPAPKPTSAPTLAEEPAPPRRAAILIPILLAVCIFVVLPIYVIRLAIQSFREEERRAPSEPRLVRAVDPPPAPEPPPAPPPKSAPAPKPVPPPPPPPSAPPPPKVFSPEEIAAERARAEAFVATAEELIGLRDYERFDALMPDLKSPQGRARLDEVIAPHRRAARAWHAALEQLKAMQGRIVSFTLRFDGGRLYGRLEEVKLPKIRVGVKEAGVRDLDTASIARLAGSGPGAATDLEILTFAIFEKDAATARAAAEDAPEDPWASPRLAALVKEADEKAAKEKSERTAELALRAADRAYKDYRPEMWWDVADLHPGTAAGKSALEKVTALRTSLARWAFNDGKAAGWTGELEAGGRWGRGGSRLKGAVQEGIAVAELRGAEPLFAGSRDARLRFDLRIQGKGKVTVTLEGEGGKAAASLDSKSFGWQSFDRPLAEFEGAALADGKPVRAIRIESRSEGAVQALIVDSIEVYAPK
jgi:hypothetical protein